MNHTPKSAWLKKLTSRMGRPCWQSRFFVLLETEIRYYKDEYAVTPNYTWSLRNIDHVKQVTMAGQSYCLSLEPTISVPLSNKKKSLILSFQAAIEMQEWQQQIASRLTRLCTPLLEVPSPSTSTTSSSSSLGRRRGVILSSLDVSKEIYQNTLLPTLESPTASTASILSSASSISTATFYHHLSYSTLSSQHPNHTKSNEIDDDEASSPTFLQYKNQFHL